MQDQPPQVCLTFQTKTARHEFMSKAITYGDFPYELDGKNIIMKADDENRLKDLFGKTLRPHQKYDASEFTGKQYSPGPSRPMTYNEAKDAWEKYMKKINNPQRNSVYDL